MLKPLMKFASPAFYKDQYAGIVRNLHADFKAGSIAPLYKAFLLVGVTGYIVEYSAIGSKNSQSICVINFWLRNLTKDL